MSGNHAPKPWMAEFNRRTKTTHGLSNSSEYRTWAGMRSRCDRRSKDRKNYFDRGIRVCARWVRSFEAFYADMGPKPSPEHSIDRIDGSKGYEPKNCRWALLADQASNRRTNRLITYRGETATLSEWARRVGSSTQALRYRLNRGWSVEDALTIPFSFSNSRLMNGGSTWL